MHELGIVFNIVDIVERFAAENNISEIDKLILQIGELSSVVPQYIRACFPAAIGGTILEETKLEIEIIEGIVKCTDCFEEYNLINARGHCPDCGSQDWIVESGEEFMIKEIVAC